MKRIERAEWEKERERPARVLREVERQRDLVAAQAGALHETLRSDRHTRMEDFKQPTGLRDLDATVEWAQLEQDAFRQGGPHALLFAH